MSRLTLRDTVSFCRYFHRLVLLTRTWSVKFSRNTALWNNRHLNAISKLACVYIKTLQNLGDARWDNRAAIDVTNQLSYKNVTNFSLTRKDSFFVLISITESAPWIPISEFSSYSSISGLSPFIDFVSGSFLQKTPRRPTISPSPFNGFRNSFHEVASHVRTKQLNPIQRSILWIWLR